jgi:hypothetical protein
VANAIILQHRTEDEHFEETKSSLVSISGGKRKRVQSQSASVTNLKSRLRSTTVDIPSGSLGHSSAVSRSRLSSVVLKSAFRPPTKQPKWMRDPEMVQYSFTYSTAEFSSNGNVIFTSMEPEKIEIARDWAKGEKLYDQGEVHEATGFIGKGYTKLGIYVCSSFFKCNGQEVDLPSRHDSVAKNIR